MNKSKIFASVLKEVSQILVLESKVQLMDINNYQIKYLIIDLNHHNFIILIMIYVIFYPTVNPLIELTLFKYSALFE